MSHTSLPAGITTVLLFAVSALAAQPSQTAPVSTNTPPDAITLKGCVAESMGRCLLDNAVIVKPIPTPVPSTAAEPPQKQPSDNHIYALVGPQIKAHVGHQVEVAGTMPARTASEDRQAPERTAHPIAGTVNVKTVTMLAATCR